MPFLPEEGSESPPIRRSISTDRGAHIKNRINPDTSENPPLTKSQYPTRAFINRSLATLPILPSTENKRGYLSSQDNISEEEQFKKMLNVRHGGIGKPKHENNPVKSKSHLPVKIHKADTDAGVTVEEGQRSDYSETENERVSTKLHVPNGMKKFQRSSSRSSSNAEIRY